VASSRKTGTSENVSTYDSAGGKDYSALTTWEQATDNDLVTATQSEVLECYAGAHADGNLYVTGATISSSYMRIIRPASGEEHKGIPKTDGSCVEFHLSSTAQYIFAIVENYFKVQDIVTKINSSYNGGESTTFNIWVNAGYVEVVGCMAIDSDSDNKPHVGHYTGDMGNNPAYWINCMVMNITSVTSTGTGFFTWAADTDPDVYWYNCTAKDCANAAFSSSNPQCLAKNCISQDNGSDFVTDGGGAITQTTCTSADTVTFRNEGSDDLHLANTDTTANGQGTDLSGDAIFAFDDDIDFKVRTTDWDIGFDQYSPHLDANSINLRTTAAKKNGTDTENIKKINGNNV